MSSTLKLHVLATPLTRLRNRVTNSINDLPEKSSDSLSANSWDGSEKQVSWKLDKVPLKSTNQTAVCLLIVFLIESESSITSPPKNKTCCLKRRDVKNRTNTASAGPRIPLFMYERMSVPYKITDIVSLRRFASENWHYEFKGLWLRPYKVLI